MGLNDPFYARSSKAQARHSLKIQLISFCFSLSGFVTYSSVEMVDAVQSNRPHKIDNKEVETKRATPRENAGESGKSVKKVFIGGLKDDIDDKDIEDYFSSFGSVVKVEQMTDKATGRKRGFGFVEFDDYDAVDKMMQVPRHQVKERRIDIRKALGKNEMNSMGGGNFGGGGRGGRNAGGPSPWGSQGYGGGFGNNAGGYGGGGYGGGNAGGWGGQQGGGYGSNPWQGGNSWGSDQSTGWSNGSSGYMTADSGWGGGYGSGNAGMSSGGGAMRNSMGGGNRSMPYTPRGGGGRGGRGGAAAGGAARW